ncbi:MAG: sugar isomerase domain-containing protein [Cohaesibacteraceae bacterium]|nr:sugar isomerase domain-containing protein [Cohaesibacteraceae bacterium]
MHFLTVALPLLEKTINSQLEVMELVVAEMVSAIEHDEIIYTFGTGHSHMLSMEFFARAGGLANIAPILDPSYLNGFGATRSGALERLTGIADIVWDEYDCSSAGLLFIASNSGLNASSIEFALRAKKEDVTTVAITSVAQSTANASKHPSGEKLMNITDFVIDNGAPNGDGILDYGSGLTGGFSSLSGIAIVQSLMSETIRLCGLEEIDAPFYQSQNTERKNTNADLYKRFKSRIKHL